MTQDQFLRKLPRWLQWPYRPFGGPQPDGSYECGNDILPWWWLAWAGIWLVPFFTARLIATLCVGLATFSRDAALDYWDNS